MNDVLGYLGLGDFGDESDTQTKQDIFSFVNSHPVLKWLVYSLLMLLSLFRDLLSPGCVDGRFEARFYNRSIEVAGNQTCYQIFVPDDYDPAEEWPVILFWHGKLESGTDGLAHLDAGIGPALRKYPEFYPCLVVMPQLPWQGDLEDFDRYFDAALADTLANYNVDEDRIYMTGISFGASGTWHYAAANPDLLAAIMPIAGSGKHSDIPNLLDIPIWTFYNYNDQIQSPDEWLDFVEALEDAGADIDATLFSGTEHTVWDDIYQDDAYINWLLLQVKN